MRQFEAESWMEVRRMPPGRRQWVFANTRPRLPARLERLIALCVEGEREEAELLATMLRFKGNQAAPVAGTWPREVVEADVVLDRRVGSLADFLRSMATLFVDTPTGVTVQRLLQTVFPAGVAFYTAQPYIEQAARVKTLLDEIARPTWAELVAEPLVQRTIAEVAAAHAPYSEKVRTFVESDRLLWDEVKAKDLANHRRLCTLVAGVLYELADDPEARRAALGPVTRQDQEVYEALRERRRVLDVDPTTGQPV